MSKIVTSIKLAMYGFFSWMNIDQESFNILMILMLIDSALGIIKSIRLGYKFSFNRLLWGFCLKLCFLIIPLIVALLAKILGHNFSAAINIVITILSVSEGYSALGNIYSAKNKTEIKKIDFVSILLKTLRVSLKNFVMRLTKKIEDTGDCKIK